MDRSFFLCDVYDGMQKHVASPFVGELLSFLGARHLESPSSNRGSRKDCDYILPVWGVGKGNGRNGRKIEKMQKKTKNTADAS